MARKWRGVLRLELPCDATAPGAARRAVDEVNDLSGVRQDARLVVSELVTNAIRHSGSGAVDTIELRVQVDGVQAAIAVRDPARSADVPQIKRLPGASGGLGLRLVQHYATEWSFEREDGGRTVWASLALG